MASYGVKCRRWASPMAEGEDSADYLPQIKRHSLEKLKRHNYYAAMFARAMRKKWPNLVYIGLYSGAGRARVTGTNEVVDTSALAVLRQEVLFDRYIFVDADPRCTAALERTAAELGLSDRVHVLTLEVNRCAEQVQALIPPYRKKGGVLSLCFVDPFRIDLDFEVLRLLSGNRMDFLMMMPLGYDVRRNIRRYLDDPKYQQRLGAFLGCPDWVGEWRRTGTQGTRHFLRFALRKFDEAMEALGYRRRALRDTAEVKVAGMGVFLYALVLYSKHERGEKLWKETLRGTSKQSELPLFEG